MKIKTLMSLVPIAFIFVNTYAGAPTDLSKAYILKKDGTVIEGTVQEMACTGFELEWVVVNTPSKSVEKFKAKDIMELSFDVSSSVYETFVMSIIGYNSYSADIIDNTTKAAIVTFVSNPNDSKAKPSVLESFNKVFGNYIKVESMEKNFLVNKGGQEIEVTESNYLEVAENLYGDCPEFNEVFVNGSYSYKDIQRHIMAYNLLKRL